MGVIRQLLAYYVRVQRLKYLTPKARYKLADLYGILFRQHGIGVLNQ